MSELEELKDKIKKIDEEEEKDWFRHPERLTEISRVGDLHVEWFLLNYVERRLESYMSLFDEAYKLMTKRKNFSRRSAFGEMHGDNYMWVCKCDHSQVICLETQSCKFLYIRKSNHHEPDTTYSTFHIRQLWTKYLYCPGESARLKGLTLKMFKDNDFSSINGSFDSNKGLWFGDNRDNGFVLSINKVNDHVYGDVDFEMAVSVIDNMAFWEIYLDDPTQLE